jgi:hypothetical protein
MQSVILAAGRAPAGSEPNAGISCTPSTSNFPRGTSRTVVLHLIEPAGTGAPIVLRQPLVRPLNVTVKNALCS